MDATKFDFRFKTTDNCGWKGVLGPGYVGCVNTGRQPLICRDKMSKLYIVGHVMLWDYYESLRIQIRMDWMYGEKKKTYTRDGMTLWVFKHKSAALYRFALMCEEVEAFNQKQRNK